LAFNDVQLPTSVERGATGGPRFNTTVITLSSGFEKRNINWEKVRGAWDIGYGIQKKEDFSVVLDFFYARQGKANSFRFKDWSDFQIGDTTDDTSRQSIGTGDGSDTTFQIIKKYISGSITYNRDITKIVSGTLRVWVNNIEVFSPAAWSVDLLTGIITFVVAPPLGQDIQVITEFDVAVRFDTDGLDVNVRTFDAGAIPNLPVLEVRGE